MFMLFIGPIIGVSIAIIATVCTVASLSGVIANELAHKDEEDGE